MTDANELRQQATQQKQAFEEKFGYPAGEVPGIWVGQQVTVNMLGGRGGDRQLAPTRASGMLEAISLDGVVLSVEDRVVFIPRESVLEMELYETRGRGSRLRLEQWPRDARGLLLRACARPPEVYVKPGPGWSSIGGGSPDRALR